ncbi:MAG: GNAT family N-acetyltransferase [Pseudomonadota bacterium]
MIDIPTLYTERLTLRAPQWSDFEAYAEFRGSERARILGGPFTRAQAFDQLCAILGHWELRGYGRWMVADRATDAPMGIVGNFFPEDWPEPEIAWSVFENAEGKGIAFEAAMEARRYAYEVLGWDTAISLIADENARSKVLAERMGAKFEKNYEHAEYGVMPVYRHPSPEELS